MRIGAGLAGAWLLAACAAPPEQTRTANPQKPLIEETVVAKHRCARADGDVRPFVVEWDATDLSDFEAHASRDIVFVKYEQCALEVLTGCVDGSLRGKHGAYHAPRWTSGGVESVSITDETELYAKLPLGALSLEGRVQRGEKLELLYFVSGVTSATRDSVSRRELADSPRCQAATHFVHAFNLGAFELDTRSRKNESGAGNVGAGSAGVRRGRDVHVLRQAGVLESCRGESAKDTLTCRVPIRLHLRPLGEGSPHEPAAKKEETPAPTTKTMFEAGKLRNEALQKLGRGDGVGCLRDLERAREIDPDTDHIQGQLWGQCTMRAGKCDAGKALLRRYYETEMQMAADVVATMVASQAKAHCAP